MKSLLIAVACLLALSADAEWRKPLVFVDKFIPTGRCQIDESGLQAIRDLIIGNIVSSRKYEVVERENLAVVQRELKMVDAGMTEGTAPDSNKLKAAGYCVYGKVLQYRGTHYSAGRIQRVDGTVELQIRFVNVENGRQLAAKTVKAVVPLVMSGDIATDRDLEQDALTKAVGMATKEVVIKLNDIAFPVYVMSITDKFVTANVSEEQVTIGDIWEAYTLGDEEIDDQTGESEGYAEEFVGNLRVARPGAKKTKFEPLTEKDKKDVLEAWEEASGTVVSKNGRRRPRMVLHKAPENVAAALKSGKSPAKTSSVMSQW